VMDDMITIQPTLRCYGIRQNKKVFEWFEVF